MKKKIIASIIILLGLCLLLYPVVGNVINVIRQDSIHQEYNNIVRQLNEDTKNQIKNEADEYNKKLAGGELSIISTDEDSIDGNFDDGSGYSSALDIGTETIAFIKIPKIDIELPVFRGTNALALEKGIGHLRNTSLPVGGESSHCVLTGHTGMPSSMLFTDLNKLVEGDKFYIQYLDEIHAYQVDQIKIVEPTDNSDLRIVPDKDYVTLLTCYPYGINSHRLLVRGERVPFNGEITFGDNNEIQSITGSTDETIAESDINDLEKSNLMVSVYGLNVPLKVVIISLSAIVVIIVAVIILSIIKSVKKSKKKKNKE